MSEVKEVRLGDVLKVHHGFAFKSSEFSDDLSYPTIVTPGNFSIGGGFKDAKPKTFSGDFPPSYELAPGDLVVTMTDLSKQGDTLGMPAVIPSDRRYLHNQRIGLVEVLEPNEVSKSFLSYYLRTRVYKEYVLGTASGSTVRHTSPSRIEDFVAHLPKINTQRAIAEVLGALDDKIAANNNLARLTNDLADSVFRQALLKAEFSNETFADISRVSGGGTPSTKQPEYWNGDVLWATPTDVTALMAPYLEGTSRTITEEGLSACASELYPAGTILMTSRATIGSFALTQFPTAVNQGFIVVQPTDKNLRYWIFHEMRSRVAEFTAFANGATFLELSRGNFKNFRVRQAPYDVMVKFNETAGSLHKLGRAALVENQTLSSVRDTLLPQLMSGKIRVREAEAVVEDVL